MNAEEFEILYHQTAKPLKSYLMRLLNNPSLADEILQETYYRILRAELRPMDEQERKNYLFRVATNLVTDQHRGRREAGLPLDESRAAQAEPKLNQSDLRQDLNKAMNELRPREQQAVWLAYVEGSSHREIAEILGLREVSIRPMLFRARQKLAALLQPFIPERMC